MLFFIVKLAFEANFLNAFMHRLRAVQYNLHSATAAVRAWNIQVQWQILFWSCHIQWLILH